jgi:hypothetical protein
MDVLHTTQVLIYHGALDIICHFPGAQEMLATTNWKGKEEFHKSERKALWLYNEVHIIFLIGQKRTLTLLNIHSGMFFGFSLDF